MYIQWIVVALILAADLAVVWWFVACASKARDPRTMVYEFIHLDVLSEQSIAGQQPDSIERSFLTDDELAALV